MKTLLFIFCFLFTSLNATLSHRVVVSIAPYKFFAEKIAENSAEVQVLVPAGASFHHFEPTPKQAFMAANADIFFRVGEPFEDHVIAALKNHHPEMKIVDLRENVSLIADSTHTCCGKSGADLHIWLSPKEAKIQATTIAKALINTYPENKELYQKNLKALLLSLDTLDSQISEILSPLKQRTLMVSHPAYAYLARDYNLQQLPIEFEGRDPSPRQLDLILKKARSLNIKTIFAQKQYSSKGAELLARELHACVITLDPYSADYFESMIEIAKHISQQEIPHHDR